MHLILLLNFNTKLAIYPAAEMELITSSPASRPREPATRGPWEAALQLWLEKRLLAPSL